MKGRCVVIEVICITACVDSSDARHSCLHWQAVDYVNLFFHFQTQKDLALTWNFQQDLALLIRARCDYESEADFHKCWKKKEDKAFVRPLKQKKQLSAEVMSLYNSILTTVYIQSGYPKE